MAIAEEKEVPVQITAKQDDVIATQGLSYALLAQEDDKTSNAVMQCFAKDETFLAKSEAVTAEIQQRDDEDAAKLQTGVDKDVELGVLEEIEPPTYVDIDVMGKTAKDVAQIMLDTCGDAANTGCVIVLVGLSGTGKGTTVKTIRSMVEKSLTWSNGNVFRSLTLLAATKAEKDGVEISEFVENKQNLVDLMECLTFKDHGEDLGLDTCIHSEELEIGPLYVNQVKNTILKQDPVPANIPTVAGQSQGMVVKYVDKCVTTLQEAGFVVLVEGREATVNYVQSPYRFRLMLDNPNVIGQRRMVQRMVGEALKNLVEDSTPEQCYTALEAALASF